MAIAEFSPSTRNPLLPSQFSSRPTNHLYNYRLRVLRQRPQRLTHAKVFCSVAPNQVQAPVAAPPPTQGTGVKKSDCFGVFCVTYDLKAEAKTKSWKSLINIAVSGAAGMISNHLLFKEFWGFLAECFQLLEGVWEIDLQPIGAKHETGQSSSGRGRG